MTAVSPDFVNRLEALRAELLSHDGPGTQFSFQFTEEQLLDLASGYVPASLKAAFCAALDWHEEDKRRAARPIQPTRQRGPKGPGEGRLPI